MRNGGNLTAGNTTDASQEPAQPKDTASPEYSVRENNRAAQPSFSVVFDGSFDGFLCVIYAYYYQKVLPWHIQSEDIYQKTLEAEEYYIATEPEKAARVMEGIRQKISPDAAQYIYNAFLAGEEDKYMDMFRYIRLGFKVGPAVDDYLQADYVMRVHRLAKYVGHETHLLTGFCRFAETKQGVYYCVISPKNQVLPLLAEHFRNRFMNHAWIIHDKKHGLAAVYDGNECLIENVSPTAHVIYTDDESQIQDLWTAFFNTVAIEERKSKKRQRQHIPLYFRGPMTEFQKKLLME